MSVHKSWSETVDKSYRALSAEYRSFLEDNKGYFPDFENFLNAFKSLPKDKTKAILFGQDPYPREKSAIGYAFIDGNVKTLFSQSGLSKEVNRATSLRNFIKMLLLADNKLTLSTLTQEKIATLDKSDMIDSIFSLRDNFEKNGVLLLNTALIFTSKDDSARHVKEFGAFMRVFLSELSMGGYELILFGAMAKTIKKLLPREHNFKLFESCHPYNIEFITDEKVHKYFALMKLLTKDNY